MVARLPSTLSITDASNTTIPNSAGTSVNVAEGCAPENVNDGIRALAAIIAAGYGGMYSGATRPAAVQSGSLWRDTDNDKIYYYDGTDDILVVDIDASGNSVSFTGSFTGDLTGNADTATALDDTALASAGVSDLVGVASQAEAEAGTDNTKAMTPLRVAQAITELGFSGGEIQYDEYTATTGLTAVIPFDNTEPQSSEGTEILSTDTVTVTAGQTVLIWVSVDMVTASAGNMTLALFRDSTVLSAQAQYTSTGEEAQTVSLIYRDQPGAGSYVYSARVGPESGLTMYTNADYTGSRHYGGSSKSYLLVQVI